MIAAMTVTAADAVDIVEGYATLALAPPLQSTQVPRAVRLALQAQLLERLSWGTGRPPSRRFVIYWRGFLSWEGTACTACGEVVWHDGDRRRRHAFAVGFNHATLREPNHSAADLLALHLGRCRRLPSGAA